MENATNFHRLYLNISEVKNSVQKADLNKAGHIPREKTFILATAQKTHRCFCAPPLTCCMKLAASALGLWKASQG